MLQWLVGHEFGFPRPGAQKVQEQIIPQIVQIFCTKSSKKAKCFHNYFFSASLDSAAIVKFSRTGKVLITLTRKHDA